MEDKGNMRDALHRLYQARHLYAKFFVIGPENNRKKFEEYLSTAPYRSSRKLYNFRNFKDVNQLNKLVKDTENFKSTFGIE